MKNEYIEKSMVRNLFLGAYGLLEKNKEMVNDLNVFPVPDGDTGTNMALTMNSAIKDILKDENLETNEILEGVAKGSLMGARGNSGVILSQLLRGFTKKLIEENELTSKSIALAFKEGSDLAYKAVMKPIEGTILTVARECSSKAMETFETTDTIEFLEEVIRHGEETLDKTPEMLPVLKEAGVVDAGGKGFIILLKGALSALTGEEIEINSMDYEVRKDFVSVEEGDLEFKYCTEFIINNTDREPAVFRKRIEKLGDSMIVVGADGVIKVHVHTNNPGEVIEKALKLGELIDIKIDNMRYQTEENHILEFKNEENKEYGIIVVSSGDGIEKIFKELGVDIIVAGGQTMNPSTEDLLQAVNRLSANTIIILPNNGNIILSANQAKSLSDKKIEVIPTKSVQEGLSALLTFNPDEELENNISNMNNAYKGIKTGEITYSIKDTVIEGREIKKNDIMGIASGEIKKLGKDVKKVTIELLEELADSDTEIITLLYGEGISEKDAEEMGKTLEELYPSCDLEIFEGGQPLYYYLISVE